MICKYFLPFPRLPCHFVDNFLWCSPICLFLLLESDPRNLRQDLYIFLLWDFFLIFFLHFINELVILLTFHIVSIDNHYFKMYVIMPLYTFEKREPLVKMHGEKIKRFEICVLLQRSIDMVYWYFRLIKIQKETNSPPVNSDFCISWGLDLGKYKACNK